MAYSIRVGSDRVDNLTAGEALARAEQLRADGHAQLFLYGRFGDPISFDELVQAAADEEAEES